MNQLSTKHYVLILFDQSKFFLDDEEYKKILEGIEKGAKGIFLKNGWIATSAIMKIVSGNDYQEAERFKRGDYKCPSCDEWIPKGKSCGKCL